MAPGPLGTRKAKALRSDVFPEPEGPIKAKRLPPLVSPESAFRITRVSRVPSFFFLVTLYVMSRHCNTTPWSVGRISPTAIFDIAAVCRRPARMSLKMKEKPATRAEHVFVVRSEVVHGVIRVDDKALQKSAFHESVYPLANLTPFRSYFLLYIS